jgi:hypothetical protein
MRRDLGVVDGQCCRLRETGDARSAALERVRGNERGDLHSTVLREPSARDESVRNTRMALPSSTEVPAVQRAPETYRGHI